MTPTEAPPNPSASLRATVDLPEPVPPAMPTKSGVTARTLSHRARAQSHGDDAFLDGGGAVELVGDLQREVARLPAHHRHVVEDDRRAEVLAVSGPVVGAGEIDVVVAHRLRRRLPVERDGEVQVQLKRVEPARANRSPHVKA